MNKVVLHTHANWKWSDEDEFQAPTLEAWNWFGKTGDEGEVHIFEDLLLESHVNYKCKIKIAFILECPEIYKFYTLNNPAAFNPFTWIATNYHHFDYVMSPYLELKKLFGEKFFWVPALSSRVKRTEFGLYEKERNVSMIASFKDWTYGHKLRHEIIKKYSNYFDTYGSGYNNIINTHGKLITIAPYRFSFCVLNSIEDDFFTEALTDVFAVGTIPIVFGTPTIARHWNPDGFIMFNTLEELREILPTLTPELYESKLEAVKENIEITKKFVTIPDFIYENYKSKLEEL